jgi:hypothetical protein
MYISRLQPDSDMHAHATDHPAHVPRVMPVASATRREISCLLSAAIVSRSFAQELLTNPEQALRLGYQGRSFHFSPSEIKLISSIHASSLREFAKTLTELMC